AGLQEFRSAFELSSPNFPHRARVQVRANQPVLFLLCLNLILPSLSPLRALSGSRECCGNLCLWQTRRSLFCLQQARRQVLCGARSIYLPALALCRQLGELVGFSSSFPFFTTKL